MEDQRAHVAGALPFQPIQKETVIVRESHGCLLRWTPREGQEFPGEWGYRPGGESLRVYTRAEPARILFVVISPSRLLALAANSAGSTPGAFVTPSCCCQ